MLAELSELDARTPGGIPSDETNRAQAILDDVSAFVLDLVDNTTAEAWEEEPPAAVIAVVCAAAGRALVNPYQHASVTEGSYTWRADNTSGVWLTDDEKTTIRRSAGLPGWAAVEVEHHSGFDYYPHDGLMGH